MRKKIFTRLAAGLLCTALLFTDAASLNVWAVSNNPSADEIASLAEPGEESDINVISEEENDIKETEASLEKEAEEEKTESATEEETDEEETENPNQDTDEQEGDDVPVIEGEENVTLPVEEEQESVSENAVEEESSINSVMADSSGDIASGTSNNISWVIDKNGKLTVSGTGDFERGENGKVPWFEYRGKVKTAQINVSGMKDASDLFSDCENLTDLDVSNFSTENVTTMANMFCNCTSLKKLELSSFNTESVLDMSGMFWTCENLTELDVSNFNTGKVTTMSKMFLNCYSLKELDLSSFDTGNVTDTTDMFGHCESLIELDLSKFNTRNVTDMFWMFGACHKLKKLNVSEFDTKNVTRMSQMFTFCESLTELDLSSFDTENVTDMHSMFEGCESLKKLDVSSFDTGNVRGTSLGSGGSIGGMACMFNGCKSLTELDVSGFDTQNVLNMGKMFGYCKSLKKLDVSGFNTRNIISKGFMNMPGGMQSVFIGCESLTELDLSNWDMGNINIVEGNVEGMLEGCSSLDTIYTPLNVKGSITLPKAERSDVWYHANTDETLKELPQNLSYSVLITKNKKPEVSEPYITAVKKKTTYVCGDSINTNDITVIYFDDKGAITKLTKGFTTNADEINRTMSTPGKKALIVTYIDSSASPGRELTAEIELTVTLGLTQENTVITLPDIQAGDNPVYNGRQHTPRVEVKLAQGGTVLAADMDYTVSYKNNIHAGEATVNVTGMGIYSGTVSKTFTIAKAPLTLRVKDMNLAQNDPVPETFAYETEGFAEADRDKSIKTSFTFKDKDGNPVARENVDTSKVTSETGIFYYVIPSETDAGTDYDVNKGAQEEAIRGKLTITAERIVYTVTFDMAGHGDNTKIREIKAGSLIKEPVAPTAEGYLFTGWYKDQACTKAWNFAVDTVLADTTLYARWVVQTAKGGIQIQEIPAQFYTGNAIKPVPAVYSSDGTLLKVGKDYTIKYVNNVNADQVTADGGTYNSLDGSTQAAQESGFNAELPYVEIKGKGSYTGAVYRNFHIRKAFIGDGGNAAAGFTLKYSDQLVTNAKNVQKPFSSLKYKKAMTAGKDYTVTYSSDNVLDADGNAVKAEDGGKWSVTGTYDTSKNNKYTLPAIPKGYSGVFEMTVKGIGNYEGEIKREIYVTDKANLIKNVTVTLGKNQKNMSYNDGNAVTLTPGYNDGKKYYKVNTDGTIDSTPEANANDLFTVKSGKKFLVWGKDYTVTYANNMAVGNATMTITGIGDYKGSKSASFKITGEAFKANTIDVKIYNAQTNPNNNDFKSSMPYTGSAVTQNKVTLTTKVTKTNPAVKKLRYGEHYTISYKNNIKKGTATMTFTAKPESGYSGSFNKTFKIGSVSLADPAFVKAEAAETTGQKPDSLTSGKDDKGNTIYQLNGTVTYTKEGAKPTQRIRLTLCDGKGNPTDVVLEEGTDYTVSFANNTVLKSATTANKIPTMTFKGKGNYTGSLKVTFDISEEAMEAGADNLTVSAAAMAYDSKKVSAYQYAPKITVLDGKKALSLNKDYTVVYQNCSQQAIGAYLDALADKNMTWDTLQSRRPYAVITSVNGSGYTTGTNKGITVYLDIYRTKLTGNNLYIIVSDNIYSGQQVMPSQVTVYYSADTKAITAAKKAKETDEVKLTSANGTYKLTRLTPQTESNGAGDYTLTYGANVTAGKNKGSVTVTGTGMYGGSVTMKFTILQRDVYTAP